MEAFRAAVDRWEADILEMDVRATADGEIVVIHDERVDRTCDGTGRVADMTWDQIRTLDAGHHFVSREGEASFRGRGVRIPRFEDVLLEFPEIRLNVDSKAPGAAAGLVGLIRKHGAEHRVLVAAVEEEHRRDARGYPGPWGASRRQIRAFWLLHRLHLSRFTRTRADALQVPPSWQGRTIVTPRFLRDAHRANLPVHVWVVDDPDEMRRLLAWDVDGIQTDRPDVLARVLVEEAGRSPPPGLRAEDGRKGSASFGGS